VGITATRSTVILYFSQKYTEVLKNLGK